MNYYLGIDGGGSKTHVCVMDADAHVLFEKRAPSIHQYHIGVKGASDVMMGIFAELEAKFGVKPGQYAGICLASAGVDREYDVGIWEDEMDKMGANLNKTIICGDGPSNVAGANGGVHGGVIAAGTGSIAYGVRDDGAFVRAGGYGNKFDDYGSGYAIAVDGIHAALEMYDGRGPETAIYGALLKLIGVSTMDAALGYLHEESTGPREIAALNYCVADLAGQDAVAGAILNKAARGLHSMVVALSKNMRQDVFALGLCGGILKNIPQVRDNLIAMLKETHPGITPHAQLNSAAYGAGLLAIRGK